MKKKITAIALVVCLLAVAVVGGTLAYFTDYGEAANTFTVGNVDIELTEPNWEKVEDAYPGQVLPKDPTVGNIGANPCFVRIQVTGLDQYVNEYGPAGSIIYRTGEEAGANSLGTGWVRHGDYFYYTKVLNSGEETTALFNEIVIPACLVNGAGAEGIVVKAQAVQSQGSGIEDPTDTTALAAWFTTCSVGA